MITMIYIKQYDCSKFDKCIVKIIPGTSICLAYTIEYYFMYWFLEQC